jgi:2-dehydro-3-deoxyphosphooctonate aldolase (KDO 8-P synthase)
MVPHLARAAAAVGVDGFFFETHFDPTCALSDGPNMLTLEQLSALTETLLKLDAIKGYKNESNRRKS